jgi:Flp pilus assembly CpaF family ATPase
MGRFHESVLQKVAIRGMAASVAVLLGASVARAQPALDARLREGDKVSVSGPDIGKVGSPG